MGTVLEWPPSGITLVPVMLNERGEPIWFEVYEEAPADER